MKYNSGSERVDDEEDFRNETNDNEQYNPDLGSDDQDSKNDDNNDYISGDNDNAAEIEGQPVESSTSKRKIILQEYQIEAVKFMKTSCIDNNPGCIIAHHMGLGKTITTIAFLNENQNICKIVILTNKLIVGQCLAESTSDAGTTNSVDYIQFPE